MAVAKPDNAMLAELSAYLDDELPPPERVRIEAAIHADRALMEALRELRGTRTLVRGLPRRPAPTGLAGGVVDRVQRSRIRPLHVRWEWWAGIAAAAACVAFVVGVVRSSWRTPVPGVVPSVQIAMNATATPLPPPVRIVADVRSAEPAAAEAAPKDRDATTRSAKMPMDAARVSEGAKDELVRSRSRPPAAEKSAPGLAAGAAPVPPRTLAKESQESVEPMAITIESLREASLAGIQMEVEEFAERHGLEVSVAETPALQQVIRAPGPEVVAQMLVKAYRSYRSDVDMILAPDHPESAVLAQAIKRADALSNGQVYNDVAAASMPPAGQRREAAEAKAARAMPASKPHGLMAKRKNAIDTTRPELDVRAPATRPAKELPFAVKLIYVPPTGR